MFAMRGLAIYIGLLLTAATTTLADEPSTAASNAPAAVTLAGVVEPSPNSPAEPLAGEFSLERGKHFLDSAALTWQRERDCMTCHTNCLYMHVRPLLGTDDEAHRSVRQYTEDLVTKRWPDKGPRWDAEVVMSALTLAANDAATSGTLHPVTRTALDRMWTVQQADGGFKWIDCGWPPFELQDEFGNTMAALAVSIAPDKYAQTPAAIEGIAKLKAHFAKTEIVPLHHRLMLLWADTYQSGWLKPADRQALIDQLMSLQHEDGGWSVASLGDWKRADGSPQDVAISDGYGTGLAVYLARRAGIAASDARLVKGVSWIKSNQRASGRWFTRSLHKDNKHFLTHAGSNMALMALAACDALH
jgi:squalene-hopene/tetraprenyl-beta-curcumene cyclase